MAGSSAQSSAVASMEFAGSGSTNESERKNNKRKRSEDRNGRKNKEERKKKMDRKRIAHENFIKRLKVS